MAYKVFPVGCHRLTITGTEERQTRVRAPTESVLVLLLIVFFSSEAIQPILVGAFIDRFEQRRGQIAFPGVW